MLCSTTAIFSKLDEIVWRLSFGYGPATDRATAIALIRAAVLLGAYCGQAMSDAEQDGLDHFAKRMGLAFQVVDDVLDCEADTATLGKTAGKDAANDKPTYVSLMGLGEAKQFARDLYDDALAALAPFGERAERLKQLADYIVARSF